ncbi:TetR/AcrR family transcriptional regulator [Actinospongicola halichondriae]|uniref:TetR/AcrR family transcriptional regulator n=1 Tax=Actinospongicola halichondriae TaxID=3236844 RepID=UPI003D4BA2D1
MVAGLVDATAQVLSDVGVEGLSTNKVAKAAGVSPGAIYQYFPNKEALVDALVLDRFERLESLIEGRMAEVSVDSVRAAVETLVRAVADFFTAEPGLIEILAPFLAAPPAAETEALIRWVHGLARSHLSGASVELDVTDFDAAAFIAIGVVSHFAPRLATIDDPDRRERLTAEVVELLLRYAGAGE